MNVSIAIVAHTTRHTMAHRLAHQISADYLSYDDGTLGADTHHRHVWDWHAANTPHGWAVVLEDDAQPVDGFREQLDAALAVAPAPIVSLYLGTGHPRQFQPLIQRATTAAADADWITSDHLLHAVAVAIHTDLLPLHLHPDKPTDEAITTSVRHHQHRIAYTWPSLVQHADTNTLITHRHDNRPHSQPRHAWHTAPHHHWTNKAVPL